MIRTNSTLSSQVVIGWLLVAALVFASQSVCVGENYDVYLLAGQSNMDGRALASELSDAQQKPMEQATIFYRNPKRDGEGWQPLSPRFSHAPKKYKGATFGIEIGFAQSMVKAQPETKLALIKVSQGGTNLRKDWKPGTKGDSESQGPLYREFIKTIQLATDKLTKRGDTFTIRGFLWHQGESDSKHGAKQYHSRLGQLIDRIREDIGVPNLPAVVGEVFDNGNRDTVREAIQKVAEASPTVAFVSCEGTKTSDPGTHFDTGSQLLMGNRYAEQIISLQTTKADEAAAAARKTKNSGRTPQQQHRFGSSSRPNILFITVDDLNDWVGCLGGNPDAQTPNLDRLAGQSVLFSNAHCQVALCNASRESMMTGMYASTTGIYGNSLKRTTPAYANAKHMPVWLGEHGYRTMCMGKIYHKDHGKRSRWDEIGPKTERWGPVPPNGRQFTERFGKDAKDSLAWAALDIEVGGMPDEKIAAWGIEKLNRNYDQPFFLALGFYKPHVPMTAPKRYFDQFDRESLTLPNVLENDLDDVPEIGRRWVLDRQKIIAEEAVKRYSPTYRRELVHAYHACVALVDDCIGQVLDQLDNSPYANNTIVVLCSDHGWHLGEKNHWRKWMPWEESTRSLLIVRAPKAAGNGGISERTVGLIDIYPTLADLCELEAPSNLQGESFRSLLQNPEGSWKRPALTSTTEGNHTVRSDRWRYIRYTDGTEELYDHENDPNEWHNLANDPNMKSIKKEHGEWIDRLNETKTKVEN